ncbi:beta-ketoacyl synthase [Zooshikella marina]|uniref:beta-ketoacyl synthase n=1 Tax=Zooshikella ganghwensis TaxID=202772 RepID=UPI001BB079A0|nr:beta-ketoacyl synthase [Zooshikella ganghwensis]MBU2706838.1 beta-ketoacyl synthase [Zooshikella ganghwensis]
MSRLPVIIGMGGINPAGRTSMHHGYRRLVLDALSADSQQTTLASLAQLMNLSADALDRQFIESHTLIRKLESNLFDPSAISHHQKLGLLAGSIIQVKTRQLPNPLPSHWRVVKEEGGVSHVALESAETLLQPAFRQAIVNSAGQLPMGFDPANLYPSRNHPRGLQLSIYGASDAIHSLGFDWENIGRFLAPDQIAVYAGSSMSQLDYNGNGGMMQARLLGKRVTSKQCPLGFAEMPADFINAYVVGSLGGTGTNMGACATLLYNLSQGIDAIRSGKHRLVIVGNAEAPLLPEVFDGYATMGALATDQGLNQLDGLATDAPVNHRRACRPFGHNCGFTLAESAQFFVLCDDELAVELGATIYGAIGDIFVNADGYKKSISGPGAGNYLTMAKAVACARSILGGSALPKSYVLAHGTGTPQNRITESHILSETAKTFGITQWPVTAIKSYVGHSLGVAAGDQLAVALGVWAEGIIPGITTINQVADDVYQDNLQILLDHLQVPVDDLDVAFINAKGFGGNNASAAVLAPHVVTNMLQKKHGQSTMTAYWQRNEQVQAATSDYDNACISGNRSPIYRFGEGVIEGNELGYTATAVSVPGYEKTVDLNLQNPYPDMV